MHELVLRAHNAVKEAHEEAYRCMRRLEEITKTCSDMSEQADTAYGMNECIKLLEDTRKHARRIKETAEKIGCAVWIKDGGDTKNIKTEYVTATPDIKMIASIPKQSTQPEAYNALMDWLQVPEEARENDAIRPHWPGLVSHISDLAQQGKPLPPGIDFEKTYPQYSFSPIRGRKELEWPESTDV